jgi:hypothetical protein
MTIQRQIQNLKRAADRAANVAKEDKRPSDALEDIAQDLRHTADKARTKLRALDFNDAQAEVELAALLNELLDDSETKHSQAEKRDNPR